MANENEIIEGGSKLHISAYLSPSEKVPFGEKEMLFKGLVNNCSKDEFLDIAGKWFDEIGNIKNSVSFMANVYYKPS